MSSGAGSKAWFIAASVGGVEGLKDQGFCRWNIHAIRSINQRACSNLGSYSQAKTPSSSSDVTSKVRDGKAREGEESLRKVMYLSCWGPY